MLLPTEREGELEGGCMRGGMSSGHVDSLLVSWWKADMYAEKEKIRTASQKKTTTATINKQVKGGEMTYVCHFF